MKYSKSILIAALLIISACGSDDTLIDMIPDDNAVPPGTPGSITCKIDGENFSASGVLATGDLAFTGEFYVLGIAGVDFIDQDTVGLVLVVSGNGFGTLMEGQVITGTGDIINNPLAAGEVNINQLPAKEVAATSLETDVATITITNLDRDNELISGTFSLEGLDPDTNTTVIVTEGDFTDIPYN